MYLQKNNGTKDIIKSSVAIFTDIISGNYFQIKQSIIEKKTYLGFSDTNNKTALHHLLSNDKLTNNIINDLFDLCIEYKAPIDNPDLDNIRPLHLACKRRNKYVIEKLLEMGAEPNSRDNNNMTPLHYILLPTLNECHKEEKDNKKKKITTNYNIDLKEDDINNSIYKVFLNDEYINTLIEHIFNLYDNNFLLIIEKLTTKDFVTNIDKIKKEIIPLIYSKKYNDEKKIELINNFKNIIYKNFHDKVDKKMITNNISENTDEILKKKPIELFEESFKNYEYEKNEKEFQDFIENNYGPKINLILHFNEYIRLFVDVDEKGNKGKLQLFSENLMKISNDLKYNSKGDEDDKEDDEEDIPVRIYIKMKKQIEVMLKIIYLGMLFSKISDGDIIDDILNNEEIVNFINITNDDDNYSKNEEMFLLNNNNRTINNGGNNYFIYENRIISRYKDVVVVNNIENQFDYIIKKENGSKFVYYKDGDSNEIKFKIEYNLNNNKTTDKIIIIPDNKYKFDNDIINEGYIFSRMEPTNLKGTYLKMILKKEILSIVASAIIEYNKSEEKNDELKGRMIEKMIEKGFLIGEEKQKKNNIDPYGYTTSNNVIVTVRNNNNINNIIDEIINLVNQNNSIKVKIDIFINMIIDIIYDTGEYKDNPIFILKKTNIAYLIAKYVFENNNSLLEDILLGLNISNYDVGDIVKLKKNSFDDYYKKEKNNIFVDIDRNYLIDIDEEYKEYGTFNILSGYNETLEVNYIEDMINIRNNIAEKLKNYNYDIPDLLNYNDETNKIIIDGYSFGITLYKNYSNYIVNKFNYQSNGSKNVLDDIVIIEKNYKKKEIIDQIIKSDNNNIKKYLNDMKTAFDEVKNRNIIIIGKVLHNVLLKIIEIIYGLRNLMNDNDLLELYILNINNEINNINNLIVRNDYDEFINYVENYGLNNIDNKINMITNYIISTDTIFYNDNMLKIIIDLISINSKYIIDKKEIDRAIENFNNEYITRIFQNFQSGEEISEDDINNVKDEYPSIENITTIDSNKNLSQLQYFIKEFYIINKILNDDILSYNEKLYNLIEKKEEYTTTKEFIDDVIKENNDSSNHDENKLFEFLKIISKVIEKLSPETYNEIEKATYNAEKAKNNEYKLYIIDETKYLPKIESGTDMIDFLTETSTEGKKLTLKYLEETRNLFNKYVTDFTIIKNNTSLKLIKSFNNNFNENEFKNEIENLSNVLITYNEFSYINENEEELFEKNIIEENFENIIDLENLKNTEDFKNLEDKYLKLNKIIEDEEVKFLFDENYDDLIKKYDFVFQSEIEGNKKEIFYSLDSEKYRIEKMFIPLIEKHIEIIRARIIEKIFYIIDNEKEDDIEEIKTLREDFNKLKEEITTDFGIDFEIELKKQVILFINKLFRSIMKNIKNYTVDKYINYLTDDYKLLTQSINDLIKLDISDDNSDDGKELKDIILKIIDEKENENKYDDIKYLEFFKDTKQSNNDKKYEMVDYYGNDNSKCYTIDESIIDMMVSKGCDINSKIRENITPIKMAINLNNLNLVKTIIDKGGISKSKDVYDFSYKKVFSVIKSTPSSSMKITFQKITNYYKDNKIVPKSMALVIPMALYLLNHQITSNSKSYPNMWSYDKSKKLNKLLNLNDDENIPLLIMYYDLMNTEKKSSIVNEELEKIKYKLLDTKETILRLENSIENLKKEKEETNNDKKKENLQKYIDELEKELKPFEDIATKLINEYEKINNNEEIEPKKLEEIKEYTEKFTSYNKTITTLYENLFNSLLNSNNISDYQRYQNIWFKLLSIPKNNDFTQLPSVLQQYVLNNGVMDKDIYTHGYDVILDYYENILSKYKRDYLEMSSYLNDTFGSYALNQIYEIMVHVFKYTISYDYINIIALKILENTNKRPSEIYNILKESNFIEYVINVIPQKMIRSITKISMYEGEEENVDILSLYNLSIDKILNINTDVIELLKREINMFYEDYTKIMVAEMHDNIVRELKSYHNQTKLLKITKLIAQ